MTTKTPRTEALIQAVGQYSIQVSDTKLISLPSYLVTAFDSIRLMELELLAAKAELAEARKHAQEGWDAFYQMRKTFAAEKYGDGSLQNLVVAMDSALKGKQ